MLFALETAGYIRGKNCIKVLQKVFECFMKAESQFCGSFLDIFWRFLKFSVKSLEISRICIWSKYKLFFLWQILDTTKWIFVKTSQQSKFLWKFTNKANIYGHFPTKQICAEIFHQGKDLWKFFTKANVCGNSLTKRLRCEDFQQSNFLWKCFNKVSFVEIFNKNVFLCNFCNNAIYCGYCSTKQGFVEILPIRKHNFFNFFILHSKQLNIFFLFFSKTIVGNLVTRQGEFFWKIPQNQPYCQNFSAAFLPHCKGFCDPGCQVYFFFFFTKGWG